MRGMRTRVGRGMSAFATAVAVLALLVPAGVGRAADHYNLDEGYPTELEDAFPVAYRDREIQTFARYERTDEDEHRVTLQPGIEWGIARNWQLDLEVPVYLGGVDPTGSGNVRLAALYNFNQESVYVPAFALEGGAEAPTGVKAQGVDSFVRFIASKTVGNEYLDRLHLNLQYNHKFDEADDERQDRYLAIVGYSRRLGPDALFVTDVLREQELEEGKEINLLEVGVRIAVDPQTVFSIGGGPGFGDDSPDWRITVGLQYSF